MIGRTFWNGLKVVLPLAITIAILYWLFMAIERFFGYFMKLILGRYYFPGLGFIVGIILVFFVGFLMNAWLGRKLHAFGERILRKIPMVKWLYNSLTDLMGFFDSRKEDTQTVVMVTFGDIRILGFITREDFSDLAQGMEPQARSLSFYQCPTSWEGT